MPGVKKVVLTDVTGSNVLFIWCNLEAAAYFARFIYQFLIALAYFPSEK